MRCQSVVGYASVIRDVVAHMDVSGEWKRLYGWNECVWMWVSANECEWVCGCGAGHLVFMCVPAMCQLFKPNLWSWSFTWLPGFHSPHFLRLMEGPRGWVRVRMGVRDHNKIDISYWQGFGPSCVFPPKKLTLHLNISYLDQYFQFQLWWSFSTLLYIHKALWDDSIAVVSNNGTCWHWKIWRSLDLRSAGFSEMLDFVMVIYAVYI